MINNFSKQLDVWLQESLKSLPQQLRDIKFDCKFSLAWNIQPIRMKKKKFDADEKHEKTFIQLPSSKDHGH